MGRIDNYVDTIKHNPEIGVNTYENFIFDKVIIPYQDCCQDPVNWTLHGDKTFNCAKAPRFGDNLLQL